jgi:hypothetical protein
MVRSLTTQARELGLTEVRCAAVSPVVPGAPGKVEVTVDATGRFADAAAFLQRAVGPLALTRLTLVPHPLRAVRLSVVVRRERAPTVISPNGEGIGRSRDPLQPLVLMASEVRPPWFALTEFSLDGTEVRLRGYKVLPGPASLMKQALEWAGFAVDRIATTRQGACDRFEVAGRMARAPRPRPTPQEGPADPSEFFAQDEAICRMDTAPPPVIVIAAPTGATGQGPFTLRLRDVELAEVFHLLHVLGAQDFIVDGDIVQRVTGDLEGVTLEEALQAVETAGVRVAPPAPIRRISRAERELDPAPSVAGTGKPMTLEGKRLAVDDLVRLFHDVTGIEIVPPSGRLGEVGIFTAERPWDELMAAVAHSAGLRAVADGPRRIVLERMPGSTEPPVPAALPVHPLEKRQWVRKQHSRPPTRHAELEAWSAYDQELIGLARGGGEWVAIIASPDAHVYQVRRRQRLWDGAFTAVDSQGVTTRQDSGLLLRQRLPPLPPSPEVGGR